MVMGRALLAMATGAALGLSAPPWEQAWLAWGALVPLLVAVRQQSPAVAGGLGWLAGTAWVAIVLAWLVGTLTRHTGLPLGAVLGLWLATAACLGFWVGLALAGATWASRRGWPLWVTLPVAWMALEGTQGWPLGRFPWLALGLSQHGVPGVAMWAGVIGTAGLSGLLVLANVGVAGVVGAVRTPAWRWEAAAAAVIFVVALVSARATGRDAALAAHVRPPLRLGLVQGHVAPEERASPSEQGRVLRRYERLSAQIAPEADLLVWPEAAVPFYFGDDARATRRIRTVARRHGRPLLFGSAAVERLTPTQRRYTNHAVLLAADGSTLATYTKRRLVPFGEYVPFGRWLPFVRPFIGTPQSLEPGTGPSVLTLPNGTPAGVLLCFEAIFSDLARSAVHGGARALLNLANDGWFPHDAGSAQSLAHVQMRAIELGVPIVRVANEGPSAVIDGTGRVVWQAAGHRMLAEVVEVAVPARAVRTSFTRWGGWLPAMSWTALAVMMVCAGSRRASA